MLLAIKNSSKIGVKSAVFGLFLFIPGGLASAAEHAAHVASISDLFYPFINFALYVALLFFVAKAPLLNAIKTRREGISAFVKSAGERRAVALKQLRYAEDKFSGLKAEVLALEQRSAEEARREAEAVKEAAKKKAERLIAQAKDGAASERKVLEESVRKELAQIVIERAAERLAKELDANSDRALRDRALDGLGALK